MQRNALTSPLLSLPGEIREEIFFHAVGNQLVHLFYDQSSGRFCHTVCKATASENQVYREFMSPHDPVAVDRLAGFLSFAFRTRHSHCTSWKFMDHARSENGPVSEAKESAHPMLSLTLLGACRQAYEEANLLLWTTNTFSFEDGRTLKTFVNSLHSTQRKKITRMHIDFAFDCISKVQCQQALSLSLISRLNGLRTLHVTISQPSQQHVFLEVLPALERMKVLPLQDVTIVVNDNLYNWGTRLTTDSLPPEPWLITERQEFAELTRGKLLDPNGPENRAAEMKEEQEEEQAPRKRPRIRYPDILCTY